MLKPLSIKYDTSVKVIKQLDGLPFTAKSFRNMCDVLEQRGVEWTSYARIQSQNLRGSGVGGWEVVSGLQATGNYKGQPVVIETKVGVRKHSSGYIYQFGSDEPATTTSSTQTIQRILNKIERFEGQSKKTSTKKHPEDFHTLAAKQLSVEDEEGEQDEL